MTKKMDEDRRRQTLRGAKMYTRLDADGPAGGAVYREITDVIWRAWDRRGHGGSPDGRPPVAYCVTGQQGTGQMLWYLGHDGWWRDCSWRVPADPSPAKLLRAACRDAVVEDVEAFAARRNRDRMREDVDHYAPLFHELVDAWVASLHPHERTPAMISTIASRPGVSFDRMLQIAAAGRNTGQSAWDRPTGDRWRNSWRKYHAEHAVLQIVLRRDNARKGAQHIDIPGRARGRIYDDPRDAPDYFGADLPADLFDDL